ncbi:MAG TPA: Gfo/Idh/MocA family oxidoreductase [Ruminiclostridium sp.]
MKMRIGLVGLGLIWEKVHMPIIDKMPKNFEVTAFCVRNPDNTKRWQEKYPIASAYTDYLELVKDGNIDAVFVTTPIVLNAPVTLAALKAGKDVFTEKPLAVTVKDVDEIIAAEKAPGKKVYVLEQFIYNPQLPVMQEIINSEKMGKLVSFEKVTHYLLDSVNDVTMGYGNTLWRIESDFPLGHIYDGGVHDLALIVALFGMPEGIYALGNTLREGMGKYDHIMSILSYKNSVSGVFSHSAYLGCDKNYFIIRFTEGAMYVKGDDISLENKRGGTEVINVREGDLYEQMWHRIAEIVNKGEEPLFTSSDAKNGISILEAIDKSITSGQAEKV